MGKTYRKNKAKGYRWTRDVGDTNKNREEYLYRAIHNDYIRALHYGEWVDRTQEEIDDEYERLVNGSQHQKALRDYKLNMHFYVYYIKRYNEHVERMATDREYFLANQGKIFYEPYLPRKPKIYVPHKKRVPLTKDFDTFYNEHIEGEAKWYDKKFSRGKIRDGYCSETSRCTGYKKQTSKDRRFQDRRNIHKIMLDADAADNMVWYEHKDGKKHIWNWW